MNKLDTTIRCVSILLVSLCTFGLACISANAATFFTEDFSDANSLPGPNLQFSTDGDNATFDGSVATFPAGTGGPGNAYRSYLKTVDNDYQTVDFVAEITVTMNTTDYKSFSFFGMGVGEPLGAAFSNEPRTAPARFIRASPRPQFGNSTGLWNGSGFTDADPNTAGTGTHRLQISWDATLNQLTAAIHQNYAGGPFVASHTMGPVSDPNFLGSGHIFFGSDNGVTFDDLSIVPEPTTAGLAFLALLAGLAIFRWRGRAKDS